MSHSLDLEWLEDFLEVVRQASFTDAARIRGLKQSSLSRRIQNLEIWLGAKVLDRNTSPVRPTDVGETFKQAAEEILVTAAKARADALRTAPPQAIPLYTLDTLAATFVPMAIRYIRQIADDSDFQLSISVMVNSFSECVEAIARGATPFMISYESERQRVLIPGDGPIEQIVISKDQLIPVCSEQNHDRYMRMLQTGGSKIPYSNYSAGTYLSGLVERKIDELGLAGKLKHTDEAHMADTLRNLVREGQGIAWVLHSTAKNALKMHELKYLDFGGDKPAHIDLNIVLFRSTAYQSKSVERFAIERFWNASQKLESMLSTR